MVEGGLDNQDANADCSDHRTQDFSTHQVKRRSIVEAVSKPGRKMKGCLVEPTAHIDDRGLDPHYGLSDDMDLYLLTAHVGCNRYVSQMTTYYRSHLL